jgi:DNA polymerase-3 subunit delta
MGGEHGNSVEGVQVVAIKGAQAANFVKALEPRIVAALIHGDDAGMVSERARAAAEAFARRSKPPGEVLRIEDGDLESDPDRLHTELRTVSMFGGSRVIRTSTSRKINAQFLKPLLEPGAMTGTLVVEAGQLRREDAMLKLFEGSAIAVAVACYPDEARDLASVVREAMSEAGVEIAEDARQLLVSRLGADRVLTRAEIDKLLLYVHGTGKVTVEDVEAIVGDASEMAIDAILLAASAGNGRKAINELDRAVAAGESPQGIIVMALRHFQRLHRLRALLDQGRSFEDAARSMRPPLHFKTKGLLEAQLRSWDAPRLDRAIAAISRTAKDARLSSQLEATLAERMMLELAAMVRSQRR